MRTEEIIRNLKYTEKKHSNDRVGVGQTNIVSMCKDILPKMEKLKAYEDAEEQGLLLRLPCKVGDTAYLIDKDENGHLKVYEGVWNSISIAQRNIDGDFELCGHISYDVYDFFYNDGRTMKHGMYVGQEQTKFGETVFLTKEEAEQKLAEMKGE